MNNKYENNQNIMNTITITGANIIKYIETKQKLNIIILLVSIQMCSRKTTASMSLVSLKDLKI